jgi:hypothetical protein
MTNNHQPTHTRTLWSALRGGTGSEGWTEPRREVVGNSPARRLLCRPPPSPTPLPAQFSHAPTARGATTRRASNRDDACPRKRVHFRAEDPFGGAGADISWSRDGRAAAREGAEEDSVGDPRDQAPKEAKGEETSLALRDNFPIAFLCACLDWAPPSHRIAPCLLRLPPKGRTPPRGPHMQRLSKSKYTAD